MWPVSALRVLGTIATEERRGANVAYSYSDTALACMTLLDRKGPGRQNTSRFVYCRNVDYLPGKDFIRVMTNSPVAVVALLLLRS